ncbi:MAG: hypothetical protein HY973_02970 [Candidatus Kerfeldbacteria bacterium]|nr:hypothetical protein [Candidatus Kerfeldbacteria bacterium]
MTSKTPPLTKLLLNVLISTGKEIINFIEFSNDIRHYQSIFRTGGYEAVQEFKKLQQVNQLKKTINNLKHSNLIKTKKIGKKLIISLTDKGKISSLSLQLRQAERHHNKLYTIVIFDIPETQRLARRHFRLLLRQGEFKKLQQSVWVSPRDNFQLLTNFIKRHQLNKWVNVFYGQNFFLLPK